MLKLPKVTKTCNNSPVHNISLLMRRLQLINLLIYYELHKLYWVNGYLTIHFRIIIILCSQSSKYIMITLSIITISHRID